MNTPTIIETLRAIRIRPTLLWGPPVTTGDIAISRDGRSYAVAADGSLRTGRVRPKNGKKARRLDRRVVKYLADAAALNETPWEPA